MFTVSPREIQKNLSLKSHSPFSYYPYDCLPLEQTPHSSCLLVSAFSAHIPSYTRSIQAVILTTPLQLLGSWSPITHLMQKPQVSSLIGEGDGTLLPYSCLENPMDGGAWWAAVHGVAKMTEQLHFRFSLPCIGEGNGSPLQCSCLENPRDSVPSSMGSHRVRHD